MSYLRSNRKQTLMFAVIGVLAASLAVPVASAFGATPGVTVMTTKHTYVGAATIKIVGYVVPAPAKGATASILIKNSHGVVVVHTVAPIVHGAFTTMVTAGGAAWTLAGTYTVSANVGGAVGSTTFTYSP